MLPITIAPFFPPHIRKQHLAKASLRWTLQGNVSGLTSHSPWAQTYKDGAVHEKIHLHHAETEPKWLQRLNFLTCPIPFAQGSQTTTQDLRLRPTQNRAQLGKQNRLSQTFGALLIAADSFPPKWKNCHFQIITFCFLNSKKMHILKRKTCFKMPARVYLWGATIINCHSKDSKFT